MTITSPLELSFCQ